MAVPQIHKIVKINPSLKRGSQGCPRVQHTGNTTKLELSVQAAVTRTGRYLISSDNEARSLKLTGQLVVHYLGQIGIFGDSFRN